MYLYYYFIEVEGWDLPFLTDGIREVAPSTGDVFWEWRSGDHLSTDDYCPWHIETLEIERTRYDWTHSNAIVYREEESAVYLNVRNLGRLVKIDYPSGEILWSMGRGGDFGEGLFFDSAMGDANRLPNGNTLVTSAHHGSIFEVTRAGEVVWNMILEPLQGSLKPILYKSERIPVDPLFVGGGDYHITAGLH